MKESSLQKEKRNEGRHYRNCAKHRNEMSCLCLVTRVTFCKRQYTAKKWHSTFGFSGGFSGPNIAVTGERISRVCCQRKKNKKKGTEWQNNLYWQFLEKLQNNSYWGKNTRTCTSKEERSRRWQKTPAFHCCYGLSIPCFTGGLSLFIQNSYYSISPLQSVWPWRDNRQSASTLSYLGEQSKPRKKARASCKAARGGGKQSLQQSLINFYLYFAQTREIPLAKKWGLAGQP